MLADDDINANYCNTCHCCRLAQVGTNLHGSDGVDMAMDTLGGIVLGLDGLDEVDLDMDRSDEAVVDVAGLDVGVDADEIVGGDMVSCKIVSLTLRVSLMDRVQCLYLIIVSLHACHYHKLFLFLMKDELNQCH